MFLQILELFFLKKRNIFQRENFKQKPQERFIMKDIFARVLSTKRKFVREICQKKI